jgi:hypothetical protein
VPLHVCQSPGWGVLDAGVCQKPIKMPVLQANGEGKLNTIQNSAIFEAQKYSKLLDAVQLVANWHLGKG